MTAPVYMVVSLEFQIVVKRTEFAESVAGYMWGRRFKDYTLLKVFQEGVVVVKPHCADITQLRLLLEETEIETT